MTAEQTCTEMREHEVDRLRHIVTRLYAMLDTVHPGWREDFEWSGSEIGGDNVTDPNGRKAQRA